MLDAPAPAQTGRPSRLAVADRAGGGLAVDLGLYLVSLLFAGFTALTATLPPHGAWGRIAIWGYAAATLLVLGQLAARRLMNAASVRLRERRLTNAASVRLRERRRWLPSLTGCAARAWLTVLTWAGTALLPLVVEAAQRAGGRTDRAQEEVIVVEDGAHRLLDTGTPYLSHAAIAALPPDQRLLGYLPYQPGMVLLGLPRAIAGAAWWTDARVWFALTTAVTVGTALILLRRRGVSAPPLVRALQAATVVPVCTLTLAVGGDDLPILGLCLLALALAATRRYGLSGVAVGLAGAMKLFAWPVALVLLALAVVHRRGARYALGAFGLPVLSLVPAFLVNPDAAVENVVRFPLGRGLVQSPAQSPFLGELVAAHLPGGHAIAAVLLVLAGLAIGVWLLRRPPRDARAAALVCAAGLLIAILLMPATRFGYLLYPIAYAVWAPALRTRPTLEG